MGLHRRIRSGEGKLGTILHVRVLHGWGKDRSIGRIVNQFFEHCARSQLKNEGTKGKQNWRPFEFQNGKDAKVM
jgi:hypothetical protein